MAHDVHHLPKELWNPDFHGIDPNYHHHESVNELLPEEEGPKLKLKEPSHDDPRLQIPKGKTAAAHDHVIVPKDEVEEDGGPKYGQSYEHERKEAVRGVGESAGLAPK